jgi:phage terminase large subunit-like protein
LRGYYEAIDTRKADRAVKFIKSLPHVKGRWAGKRFGLLDWQESITRDVFGTVRPDGRRQYRTVYIEVPKKNGKTELGGAYSNYMLFADGEIGAEVYYAAVDRDQAALCYNVSAQMVEWSPALSRRAKVIRSTKRIWVPETGSFSRVLSADVPNKHGINLSCGIIDELHAHPSRDLYDILSQEGGAGVAREQPLWFIITTAGYDRNSICWELHEHARQVINGTVEDPSFYGVIYGVPEDADWEDENEWVKANPSIGRIFTLDDLREDYLRAKGNPRKENLFRRLRLNQWTASETRWLDVKVWDECKALLGLEGKDCYSGLDLSSTTDLTAFSMCFPDGDEYHIRAHFWLPADNINDREKRDRVPYQQWARDGWLTLTPGNVVDYDYIIRDMVEYRAQYRINEVAFDRWGAEKLRQQLTDLGFVMVEFGQGYKSMSPPTKEFERLVLSQKLHHDGNPILRWNLDNTIVTTDSADNVKPDKAKATQRIDGVVSSIMALDRALRHESGPSIYETQGIDFL